MARWIAKEDLETLKRWLSEKPSWPAPDGTAEQLKRLHTNHTRWKNHICNAHWHFSFNIPADAHMCGEHKAEHDAREDKKKAEKARIENDKESTSTGQSQAVAGASSSSRHDPPRSGRSQSPRREDRGHRTRSRTPMKDSGHSADDVTRRASPAPAGQIADCGRQTRAHPREQFPPSGPSDGDRRARDRTPVPRPGSSAGDPTHHEAQEVPKPPSPMTEEKRRKLKMRVMENAKAVRAANHGHDSDVARRQGYEPLDMPEVRKDIARMAKDGFERWVQERDEQGWVHQGPRG